ncbi:helix-turn-helix transcriptional regulator [Lacticaseibacillus pabuli]|uniref:Helix-turn-helix transcriptional regulator n=1 Tax=Lacticaseibacillus pabuli TaxID=3025672 RepID=A0ABY7WPB9_9LACO|nr:helix-turn-helix transcriptional regulator [Lacticaseibacillus sp. KACC 23028]WDF82048.1 helix-turn-helix transcriptional regulator [Lacticaseibacillus sp. KACC 23028]
MISIKLKELLKQRGRTMTDVATATGISMNTLSVLGRGESNGIQFDTLDKLCRELGCTPNDIIHFEYNGYTFVMSVKPIINDSILLFAGGFVPKEIARKLDEREQVSYVGYPLFFETPDEPGLDDTFVVDVGITEKSLPIFKEKSTPETNRHSLDDTKAFYSKLTDNDVAELLTDAARWVKRIYQPLTNTKKAYSVMSAGTGLSKTILVKF